MFARARLITLTAAVGAAVAAPLLAAAPAWAALPGIQQPITVESRNDASFAKSATATCPRGKQLLGGTGLVVNGGSDVVLDGIKPTENSVTVEAVEDATGHPGQWKVQATAICADPVPGLERITVQAQNSGANSTEQAQAFCSAGKRVISAGADVLQGDGKVAIEDILPNNGLTNVTVKAAEIGPGTTVPWTVRATAVCAPELPELQLVSVQTGADSGATKNRTIPCPSGKRVVGTGADVISNAPAAVIGASPLSLLTNATLHAVEPEPFANASWALRGHVICATL